MEGNILGGNKSKLDICTNQKRIGAESSQFQPTEKKIKKSSKNGVKKMKYGTLKTKFVKPGHLKKVHSSTVGAVSIEKCIESPKNNAEIVATELIELADEGTAENNLFALNEASKDKTEKRESISNQPLVPMRKSSVPDDSVKHETEIKNLKKSLKEAHGKLEILRTTNEKLKVENENVRSMYNETLHLNFEFQKKVIGYFEHSEDIEAHKRQTEHNVNNKFPSVGFIRKADDYMHVGKGLYIPRQCYETAKFNARGVISQFIRNICVSIFTIEILIVSSVEGKLCNKTKTQYPALDGTKLAAVGDITRYFLQELGTVSEVQIGIEISKIGRTIGSKIQDLRRRSRKHLLKETTRSESTNGSESNYDCTESDKNMTPQSHESHEEEGTSSKDECSSSSSDSHEEDSSSGSKEDSEEAASEENESEIL